LNWNKWIRQVHRWLSFAFTAAVIANVAATSGGEQAVWIGLLALLPLVPLLASGLHLFVLPYAVRQRDGRGSGLWDRRENGCHRGQASVQMVGEMYAGSGN